jgi:hypothetical protein
VPELERKIYSGLAVRGIKVTILNEVVIEAHVHVERCLYCSD